MKREELKELELSDEQVDRVMAIHGEDVNQLKAEKKGLEANVSDLQGRMKDRDRQLSDLKANSGDNEALKKRIEELEGENKRALEEYAQNQKSMKIDFAVESALLKRRAKSTKAAKALIDFGKIDVQKDGTVVGLDDQIEEIAKDNGFLFGEDKIMGMPMQGGQVERSEGPEVTFAKEANAAENGQGLNW